MQQQPALNAAFSRYARRYLFQLLLVVLACLCMVAGVWQLTRAAQVTEYLNIIESNSQKTPFELDVFLYKLANTSNLNSLHARRVRIKGTFVGVPIFIDNKQLRTNSGRLVGYDTLHLLRTYDGKHVLIDRGWVPSGGLRDTLPQVAIPSAPVTLVTSADVLSNKGIVLREDTIHSTTKSLLLQAVNFSLLAKGFGVNIIPVLFRMTAQEMHTSHRFRVKNTALSPVKNYGYAVQWFSFALIACIGIFVLRRHDKKFTASC